MIDLGIMLIMAIMQGISLNHQMNPPAVTYNNVEMNLKFMVEYQGTTYSTDEDQTTAAAQTCNTQISFTVNPAFASRVSMRLWSMNIGQASAYVMGGHDDARDLFLKQNIPTHCMAKHYCNTGDFSAVSGNSIASGPGPYCIPSNPFVPEVFDVPQNANIPPYFFATVASELNNEYYRVLDWCERFFVSDRLVFNYKHGSRGQCNSMQSPIWCAQEGWSFDNGQLSNCQYPSSGTDLAGKQQQDLKACAEKYRLMPFFL